ncbi:proteoglycan 3-like protein [Aphelenchoides avenae]|nr:proteoglycan 3-like protein [Aphelenchus avenae]
MRQMVAAPIVSVFVVTQALAACPTGSVQGLNKHQCYPLGGHLASVSSRLTNRFLHTLELKGTTVGDYWLGAYYAVYFDDKFPNTVWSWSDGQRFAFSDWAKGEAVRRDPSCLAVDYKTGKWRIASCYEAKVYVCKVPEVTAPTGEPTAPPTAAS